VSRSQITRQIGQGTVTVNDAAFPPSRKLRAGDVVVWTPPPVEKTEIGAEAIPLAIVHEDRWLVVIDKPPGLVVHPAPGHEAGTLVNALLAHCQDLRGIGGELRPGIVHRIDKDTSGLLVVAKDDQTMQALGAAFKAHDIERVYEALVVGRPPAASGRIDTLHGRDPRDRKKFTIRVKQGRRAVTNWRVVRAGNNHSLLEVRLETGRRNQIRVHLAGIGHPITGDATYGRRTDPLGRLALHAHVLGFDHPRTGARLRFVSPAPPAFARVTG